MNVSEGRRRETLEAVEAAIRRTPETFLLSVSSDPDHNRAVYSFIASPERIADACLETVAEAVRRIDLRSHQGVHPRIGAADVVPLVPLSGATFEECVKIAHDLGEDVWKRLAVPVYFYEKAALRPQRTNLAAIRRGGFETLRQEVESDPDRRPDVGEARLHPSAGAVAIGVRGALIAWNVYLDTADLEPARRIARRIRERDGGLPAVKALGLYLESRGQCQISMNLTDFRKTSPLQVHRRIRQEAERLGVEVTSAEIIGHVPQEALPPGAERELRIENFYPGMILENRIAEVLGTN